MSRADLQRSIGVGASILLGHIVRFQRDRKFADDLTAEAVDVLQKIVVGGPLIANHIRNNSPEALTATLEDIGADIYVTDTQGELTLSKINACLKK